MSHYNVVKDRFGARSLVVEDPLPLRNFLMQLREATIESKIAHSFASNQHIPTLPSWSHYDVFSSAVAQLSQLALLAYEGLSQRELDVIIKTKVALLVPKEACLPIFQHEATRLNNNKTLSETELYNFMRFLVNRDSKGGFRPYPRQVRRPENLC